MQRRLSRIIQKSMNQIVSKRNMECGRYEQRSRREFDGVVEKEACVNSMFINGLLQKA